jgi:regulator of sigma E protease
MSWFLAFAGFAALIVLHEFGHFIAAKATGMRVERFSLFFGPMLFKVRRGETEYGVGVIPLGGYVRITGMSPHEELPEDVARRAYLRQPVWKRIVVITAGPLMNVIIAFVILFALLVSRGIAHDSVTSKVGSIERHQPAYGLLHVGDRIVAVDGRRGTVKQLIERTRQHKCYRPLVAGCTATTPAKVTLERKGELVTVPIAPRYDAAARHMRLGFSFAIAERSEAVGAGAAARKSVDEMWHVTTLTVTAIAKLFYSEKARKEVSGVVGSYEATRQSFEFDTAKAFLVLAIISLSLAIVNLFPFLPLDGGHIFWAIAEKVRGRPIPFSVMERAGVVGFMLVLLLFAIGLSNDIGRLRGAGFGIR